MLPVVENAQQLPHCPWFLTGVTASVDSGMNRWLVDMTVNGHSFYTGNCFSYFLKSYSISRLLL